MVAQASAVHCPPTVQLSCDVQVSVTAGLPDAIADMLDGAKEGALEVVDLVEDKIENRLANDRLLESSYDSLLKRY